MYELPTSVEVCGERYPIRSDYRAVLDICAALSDPTLDGQEKTVIALGIFYPDIDAMPKEHYQEAGEKCTWFIDCGDEHQNRPAPQLMDWEQDFKYIVAPVNRVLGREVRAVEYLHWWSFISAYYEIGDCLFAQIVRVRDRLARGKKLDQSDREWYRQNRHLVDRRQDYTEQESSALARWGAK